MTRSELIANCHARRGTEAAHAVILADAVIVLLAVSRTTMDRIVGRLGDRLVESARSDDGFCFAGILSANDWYESLEDVAEEVEGLTYADNRDHPCSDLEGFVWMVAWLQQTEQATDGW